jgi:hypothetical protein
VMLWLSNAMIWKCPTRRLLSQPNCHGSTRHLGIGVGRDGFLDHCRFPNRWPRLALQDLNPTCLNRASGRTRRNRPNAPNANVLEPINVVMAPFASIGLNDVLHCLRGNLAQKAVDFASNRPGGRKPHGSAHAREITADAHPLRLGQAA